MRDQLSQQRRDLPGVEVNKEYVFEGFNGKQTLSELFDGRSQLLVYHFMFGPDWEAGCPGCSFWADNFNGIIVHLNHRDVTMMVISRVPFDKLSEYQKRMGGILNRYLPLIQISISITTFLLHKKNDQKKAFYNYVEQDTPSPDREGVSIFFKDQSGRIFYTYLDL